MSVMKAGIASEEAIFTMFWCYILSSVSLIRAVMLPDWKNPQEEPSK
jgi:hypothetical protein